MADLDTLSIDGLTVEGPQHTDWSELSLTAAPGTITAVHGRNGSGTSTLFAVLAGRTPIGSRTTGEVRLAGHRIRAAEADPLTESIRTLTGSTAPSPSTVAETLARAAGPGRRRNTRRQRDELIERLHLAPRLDQRLSDCPRSVRAETALAATLLGRPLLLLVDQLLGRLPSGRRAGAADLLREAAEHGMIVLWTDHEWSHLCRVADRQVTLSGSGPPGRTGADRLPWNPAAPPPRQLRQRLLQGSPLRPERARLGGDPLAVGAGEVVGIVADDDRDAARLARAWAHDAGSAPTDLARAALFEMFSIRRALARWPAPEGTDPLRELARSIRLRPAARAAEHSSGEATAIANLVSLLGGAAALIDPSFALDEPARAALLRRLSDRSEAGHSTVMAIGDEEFAARACHRLVLVRDRQVVASGPPARLRSQVRDVD